MIDCLTFAQINNILFLLLQHPEGLTVKEIADLSGLSGRKAADLIVFLNMFSERYGLCTDEEMDEWDGEGEYAEYLLNSPQRWYIDLRRFQPEQNLPVEFNTGELALLAQLTALTGDGELKARLEQLLGYLPGKECNLPLGGVCRDRHWQLISTCLAQARELKLLTASNKNKKWLKIIPLALIFNRDTGFWYLVGLFRDEARVLAKVRKRLEQRQEYVWEISSDGRQRYRDRVAGVEEMLPWLRGFGSSAEVKKPRWVREKMLRDAKKLIEYYS
ncbi:WYL domain-containing protein [Carboxydocella sp. JDF658]|uniref:WYL domain-containing protein n=1 Tax=Carboxydocella sp. JDF658 TaxID=1926600 RepID=UPI0009AE0C32|nr:WYL domain-containing protein [Carboxydocella sp. JDF658]GAW32186.1 WYL domain-containing protein [Carboxydocella sp. JDF658]